MAKTVRGDRRCIFPLCFHSGTKGLFAIPQEPKKRALWLEACNLAEADVGINSFICIKHFKKEDISPTEKIFRLQPWAIPQRLPQTDLFVANDVSFLFSS